MALNRCRELRHGDQGVIRLIGGVLIQSGPAHPAGLTGIFTSGGIIPYTEGTAIAAPITAPITAPIAAHVAIDEGAALQVNQLMVGGEADSPIAHCIRNRKRRAAAVPRDRRLRACPSRCLGKSFGFNVFLIDCRRCRRACSGYETIDPPRRRRYGGMRRRIDKENVII